MYRLSLFLFASGSVSKIYILSAQAHANMFGKRRLPEVYNRLTSPKRFKENLADCFLSGTLSGKRTQSLFNDASSANTQHVAGMVGGASHCNRNLRRKLVKGKGWPKLYYFKARVWDAKQQAVVWEWIPILLPHELVAKLFQCGDREALLSQEGMCEETKAHVQECSTKLGCDDLLGVGIWNDGCPCNWDRTKSVEVLSLNLPGLGDDNKGMRIPLLVIMKDRIVKNQTMRTDLQCSLGLSGA